VGVAVDASSRAIEVLLLEQAISAKALPAVAPAVHGGVRYLNREIFRW